MPEPDAPDPVDEEVVFHAAPRCLLQGSVRNVASWCVRHCAYSPSVVAVRKNNLQF